MPPRSALTSSFSVTDANNEVVCPLKNHDGSSCRKRCIGEKRYRSMQEHIRRAHPEHYIPKLPATEESFLMMINTVPNPDVNKPPPSSSSSNPPPGAIGLFDTYPQLPAGIDLFEGHGGDVQPYFRDDFVYPGSNRSSDEYRRGSLLNAANAAEALAQLHDHRRDVFDPDQDIYSDNEMQSGRPRTGFAAFPPDQPIFDEPGYPSPQPPRARELLPSSIARSPPPPYYRSSTLPPVPRSSSKPNRPRKPSIGQSGRMAKHERKKSKEAKRQSYERNAMSAEPQSAAALYDKRWQDLIDAAASATEEDSRDLTPVSALFSSPTVTPTSFTNLTPPAVTLSPPILPTINELHLPPKSAVAQPPTTTTTTTTTTTLRYSPHQSLSIDPRLLHPQVPGSPQPANRGSLPPFLSAFGASNHSYTASPLARALTPPPPDLGDLQPFPSVESSLDSSTKSQSAGASGSGQNFHMSASGLSDSSPSYASSARVQIYCAGCRKTSLLSESYACTECICGLCKECVDALSAEQTRGRFGARCPRCAAVGGRFKPFQLDIR